MHFLIVGINGQLGQEWAKYCHLNGIKYSGYDLPELDITDKDSVENVLRESGAKILINCAAYTNVDGAESEKHIADLINHKAVKGLAEVCKRQKVKLVHYSTDYVFSGSESDKEINPSGYPEDFKTGPTNVYGVTKLEGEKAIIKTGCEYLILRISWLCGAYGKNFVKTMLKLGSERDELNVVNDQFGSPTFTQNVVEWTYELVQKQVAGIVHLSSSGITNWFEFTSKIFELKGWDIKINPVDSSAFKTVASRPHFSKLNTSKMSEILEKEPIHWEKALKNLLIELE